MLPPLARVDAHARRGADDGDEDPELVHGLAALLPLLLLFPGQELRGRLDAEVLVDAVEDAEICVVAARGEYVSI